MQAAAKVPTKARSKRGAHIVRQMSELCALDAEELYPPSSAGGSNASTQYDTPASKRAKLDDAPDAAHDSVASGVEPPGVPSGDVASDSLPSPASEDPTTTGMPPPTGPPPSGVSLPHVNLHIIIPSNPATPVECVPPPRRRSRPRFTPAPAPVPAPRARARRPRARVVRRFPRASVRYPTRLA